MKIAIYSSVLAALILSSNLSFAQKAIGKCMRVDCASMLSYCKESRSIGKTATNCEAAGAQCLRTKKWIGTTPEGTKWSCTF